MDFIRHYEDLKICVVEGLKWDSVPKVYSETLIDSLLIRWLEWK